MKKLIWILLAIAVIGALAYLYVFHKPHLADVASEKAAYEIKASQLIGQYEEDSQAADSLYLDQVVLVSGMVAELDSARVLLKAGISCSMSNGEDLSGLETGDALKIKGKGSGLRRSL
ncbi:MAG: hypothetical protein U5L96_04290 [Owenweeksia sp.]|nr:hypothetical protein [Owenweeksia sp.]